MADSTFRFMLLPFLKSNDEIRPIRAIRVQTQSPRFYSSDLKNTTISFVL